jgi:hypothetical protein
MNPYIDENNQPVCINELIRYAVGLQPQDWSSRIDVKSKFLQFKMYIVHDPFCHQFDMI